MIHGAITTTAVMAMTTATLRNRMMSTQTTAIRYTTPIDLVRAASPKARPEAIAIGRRFRSAAMIASSAAAQTKAVKTVSLRIAAAAEIGPGCSAYKIA